MMHKRLWGGLAAVMIIVGSLLGGLSYTTNLVGLGISLVGMVTLLILVILIRRAANHH